MTILSQHILRLYVENNFVGFGKSPDFDKCHRYP